MAGKKKKSSACATFLCWKIHMDMGFCLEVGYRKKSHGLSSLSLFFTLPFGGLPNLQTHPNIRLIFPIQSKVPWNIPWISHSRWTNPWFPDFSFIPISRQWTVSFTRWSCGKIFRVTRGLLGWTNRNGDVIIKHAGTYRIWMDMIFM